MSARWYKSVDSFLILGGHCTTKPCQNAGVCKDEPNNGANFTCVCTDKFKGNINILLDLITIQSA